MILRRCARDECGESLVELLIAIVIMGIAVAVITGGLATGIITSDVHRKQTTGDVMLRSWAEAVKSSTYANSGGCVSVQGHYAYTGTVPSGFQTPASPALSTWNGSTWLTGGSAVCNGTAPLEKLTLTVKAAGSRDSETVDVVVLQP